MLALMLVMTVGVDCAMAAAESYEAEYFTNVSLPCNFTLHNITYPGLVTPFKKYWVLPNATILQDTFPGDGKYTVTASPFDLRLFIRSIDDADFGVYHCLMIWNNYDYKMDAIRVGLNEDGPYYKKKLEEFERNLIIGSACAGVAVLLIVIVCIVCCCMRRRARKDTARSPRNVSVYSVDHGTGEYGYDVNKRERDYMNATMEKRKHDREAVGEYATVNKASVRATTGDHVTLQSAHL